MCVSLSEGHSPGCVYSGSLSDLMEVNFSFAERTERGRQQSLQKMSRIVYDRLTFLISCALLERRKHCLSRENPSLHLLAWVSVGVLGAAPGTAAGSFLVPRNVRLW